MLNFREDGLVIDSCGNLVAVIVVSDITYETRPYKVMVKDLEAHVANTMAKAQNWLAYHYKNGTLPR